MEDNFEGTQHSYTQQSSQPLPGRRTTQLFAWKVAVGTTPRHTYCSRPSIDLTYPQQKLNCQKILVSAPQGHYSMTKALFDPSYTHSCLNSCWSWTSEFKRIVMGDGNCTMTDSCGGTYFLQNDNTDNLTNTKVESNNLYAMLYK
jgi:hypothetical protein